LGPNRAGKTTLVRSIVGRVHVDSGQIRVLGATAGSPEARANLGWVPQDLALYPRLSSEENLSVFGQYAGLGGQALTEAIRWCLEWAALSDRAKEPVMNFSGGMKRRLNMAAGLVRRPPIALLDEPTVGVDPQSRERIYQMIEQQRAAGTSLIYTSHYMEEVERLCDRVAIIDHGRIIAEGSPGELVQRTFGNRAEVVIETARADQAKAAVWATQHGGAADGNRLRFSVANPGADVAQLLSSAAAAGIMVEHLSLRTPSLNEVFLHLTGKDLRE
jgi:ABC-2 type transport system ATP-binding protein